MRANLGEESVINASAQFWEQMLAMKLEPLPAAGDLCLAAGHILGSVALSGVWKGRVEVRLTERLAHQATAAMMMCPIDAVSEAEALDATKEIANIIGGVIKSSLPRPCSMTVPAAAVETRDFAHPATSDDALIVAFRHDAGDLMVRVWEEECLQAA